MNEVAVLEKEVNDVVLQAKGFHVTTQEQYEQTAEFLKSIKNSKKEVNATFDPICDKAHKTWKEAVSQRSRFLDPLDEAEKLIVGKVKGFLAEQERIRKEEEARLQEIARKEEERIRKQLEAKAEKAEAKGNTEKAEELKQQAESTFISRPTVAPTVDRIKGLGIKENWKADIYDLLALVKAVAEGTAPIDYLAANTTLLNSQARNLKASFKCPGVRAVSDMQ